MSKTLQELIHECEDAAVVLPLTLDAQLRSGLEGTHIGIIRLVDDQTLAIEVADACISMGGEKIADIPSLDVLKSPSALLNHLRGTTQLQIRGIENFNA